MIKRIWVLGLIALTGIISPAMANLPFSTYGAANGWQGSAVYDAQGFSVVVKYAVYDNMANLGEGPWNSEVTFPPGDKYIYAYQIFNVGTTDQDKNIASFTIESITHHPIDQSFMHSTSSQNDSGGGKEPGQSTLQGQWVWTPDGYIKPGDHSWYLVFSSDHSPVKGTFTVTATPPDNNVVVPGDGGDNHVPEPTSIALLSLATGIFAAYRAKKTKGQ